MNPWLFSGICLLAWGWTSPLLSQTPERKPKADFDLDDPIPYGQKPIDYFNAETDNPAERLRARLEQGQAKLTGDSSQGYLKSLLNSLDISQDSQMLVFSKTALNPKLVAPESPRAVYFNEECYVAWVPGAAALEVAAVDPEKGWLFYTLPQPEFSSTEPPLLKRESQCLACHAGPSALRIPGGLVRSFITDETGSPLSGYSRINHSTPLANRFGGWYLTGKLGGQRHRGNLIRPQTDQAEKHLTSSENVQELSGAFDVSKYPTPQSDLVAQLVFHHQIHGQNLLIRVGYEARTGKRSTAEEELIRYLLFLDEAPLAEPVEASTEFAKWFRKRGREDPKGRSLRDWDLKTRLFKYRLSYLIDTPLFEGLPEEPKRRIYQKLRQILTAEKPPEPFNKIPAKERQAILEILHHTKPNLLSEWQQNNEESRDKAIEEH